MSTETIVLLEKARQDVLKRISSAAEDTGTSPDQLEALAKVLGALRSMY